MSRENRFCLCESCTADQRLCFHYSDSAIHLIQNFKLPAHFCDCTDWFVSDLVGNPEDWVSCIAAQLKHNLIYVWKCSLISIFLFRSIIEFLNIGINHGFQCSNIRWITRKAFEHKAAGRVFKPLPSDPANV